MTTTTILIMIIIIIIMIVMKVKNEIENQKENENCNGCDGISSRRIDCFKLSFIPTRRSSERTELQRLQNRAVRVILKSDNSIPSEIARNELNWILLTAKPQFHKAILMYKCLRKD